MAGSFTTGAPAIRALTSLRGLAAMAVVFQHYSVTAQWHAARPIPSLVPHGYVAVDFFFVLSGFILCYTHAQAFERGEKGAYLDFMIRRAARLLPLQAVTLGLVLLSGWASLWYLGVNRYFDPATLWYDLPGNLLLLQGFGFFRNMNGPSGTISVELGAYALFPLLVVLALHRQAVVRMVTFGVALAGLVWLATLQPRLGLDVGTAWGGVVRGTTEFVLGMGAFAVWRAGAARFLDGDVAMTLLAGGIAAFMIAGIDLGAALLFPPAVVAAARNRDVAARVMGWGVFYFLGEVSFSLYLLHDMFRIPYVVAVSTLFPARLDMGPALLMALLGGLMIIPIATLTYYTVEVPGRRWLRGVLVGWTGAGAERVKA
jgi:peptidoglycan/LPS O-acetylase OafA/YrhL